MNGKQAQCSSFGMCGMPNSKGRSLKDIGHKGNKLKKIAN